MAERPIFVPSQDAPGLVKEISFSIPWHSGFAPVQKKKNIKALHDAAAAAGYAPLLEASTKSDEKLGEHLSAFHLKVHGDSLREIPLECAKETRFLRKVVPSLICTKSMQGWQNVIHASRNPVGL
jgi:hypothetical protein